jgi:hypothetical protein
MVVESVARARVIGTRNSPLPSVPYTAGRAHALPRRAARAHCLGGHCFPD